MTHMMDQYSPVSGIPLTTRQKICFKLCSAPRVAAWVSFPAYTAMPAAAFTLSEHASHCCSFGLGLLISDPLYLLLLRGGGFSAENAALQRTFLDAPAVLISWVKYSRLRVSWLICGSLWKQVYIFFGKHPERRELTEAKRRGEITFFRLFLLSMKTSHSSIFFSNFINHLITFSYTFAPTIRDMCILENFVLNSCL